MGWHLGRNSSSRARELLRAAASRCIPPPPKPPPPPTDTHTCPRRRGIGELVLVYKRVTGLAGHTSRVSELLERIRGLSRADEEETLRRLYLRCAPRGAGQPAGQF